MSQEGNYITDLEFIAAEGMRREEENDHFLLSLRSYDTLQLDVLAHTVNNNVSSAIDCTTCGNCCKTLVINVEPDEIKPIADYLHLDEAAAKEKYVEESQAGRLFINTIPCHFLSDNKCTVYEHRFTECREFPHLHKPGFKARLLGTLLHYGRCPIIYNVIERMKTETGFFDNK